MSWSRRILAFALLSLASASVSVRGQNETTALEEMKIDLWPEYDRPATLVMYRFRLKAGSDLSAPVAVPVPENVEDPHAVAWRDDKGSLFVADFTRRVEGDRAMVLTRLGSREGQLEFYSDIEFNDRERSFRFDWPGGVEVGALSVQIQRPRGASEFRVSPEPTRQWEGEDGLTYALVELGPQSSSAKPSIEVRYQKATERLTAPPVASAPPPSVSESRTESPGTSPWLIGAGGVVLGALGFALLRALTSARSPAPRPEPLDQPSAGSPKPIFCHECGTKGRRTDAFCMNCGTRLLKK
jgi:hypothetical protein